MEEKNNAERCACGTHTKAACDFAGVCGQTVPSAAQPAQHNSASSVYKCPCDPAGVDGVTRESCCAFQAAAQPEQGVGLTADEAWQIAVTELGTVDPGGRTPSYVKISTPAEAFDLVRAILARQTAPAQPELTVWYGAMPESNGKSNFTALLMRKGSRILDGITLDRSEYPDRVRYEADRVRYLLGELAEPPFILDYDADKHSGYKEPAPTDSAPQAMNWQVRERRAPNGELLDCFVEAPREGDMAYALEVLGDDYEGYGGIERKLEHCKLIVARVNAAPQQPAAERAAVPEGFLFWDPLDERSVDDPIFVHGQKDPATDKPDHRGHVWQSKPLFAAAPSPAPVAQEGDGYNEARRVLAQSAVAQEGETGSRLYAWLAKTAKCGLADVEAAAKLLKDYYEGASPQEGKAVEGGQPTGRYACQYCGGTKGHTEENDLRDGTEPEIWFCCHACRDAGHPCETFHRMPQQDSSKVVSTGVSAVAAKRECENCGGIGRLYVGTIHSPNGQPSGECRECGGTGKVAAKGGEA